jgi:hypothetical protein
MKITTVAAIAAFCAIGVSAPDAHASMLPNTSATHQAAGDLPMPAQYRGWDDNRRGYGRGRGRVVCRIVQQRVYDPRFGRTRIVEREVCRQRGPRW